MLKSTAIKAELPWTLAVSLLLPTLALVLLSARVDASTFHEYSAGYEVTGTGFTGVAATHLTEAITHQESNGCSSPFTGNEVYETIWVTITSDSLNSDEIGAGHQCNDTYRYYYWAYVQNGVFYPIGYVIGAVNGSTHSYKIARAFNGTNYYDYWYLDGVQKAAVYSPSRGVSVVAGLESWSSASTVAGYATDNLKYQLNEGSFNNWSGEDTRRIDGSMCGLWISATSWDSGENVIRC
jgi:hypothetical protein